MIPTETDLTHLFEALNFAAYHHRMQKRKDGHLPYINHPIEVATLLWQYGVRETDTLIAALLHDTVEDTAASPETIRQQFGETVSALVMEVTDDKSLPKTERKQLQILHAPHKTIPARQIKLADKISNLHSLIQSPPVGWSLARILAYLDWSEQVVNGLRGPNPTLEALFDETLSQVRAFWQTPPSSEN